MKSNIRKLRNERQITQSELAHVIGKTQQAVSQMEQDRDRISIESLITMADYFDVSTDYILGLNENREQLKIQNGTVSESDWVRNETENLRRAIDGDDNQLLYELILSLLLTSMKGSSSGGNPSASGV